MFAVYALKSVNRNYIYVGLAGNLEKRFDQHQSGKNKTTKPYLPLMLFTLKIFPSRQEARDKEKFLKSGAGKEFLKHKLTSFKPATLYIADSKPACRQAGSKSRALILINSIFQ